MSFDSIQAQHPVAVQWLVDSQLKSDFAASLLQQLRAKGTLSERQIAAAEGCARRALDEKMRKEAAAAQPALDISKLEATFQVAKDHGIQKPMLRLGDYKFKVASPSGNNAGAIWVTHLTKNEFGEAPYLGKIAGGRFLPSRECTSTMEGEIRTLASNPADAAKAYGQRTGMCCVCGRKLTKGESIDAMIGPICAEKYGF